MKSFIREILSIMTWDNLISRGVWAIIQPSNFFILYFTVSFFIFQFGLLGQHWLKKLKTLNLSILILVFLVGLTNFSKWIMWPLENRYAEYKILNTSLSYSGIIILGGAEEATISTYTSQATFDNDAERIYQAIKLAKQFPELPIIHSGGVKIGPDELSENDVAEMAFYDMGINLNRIRFDRISYNTSTNATESAKLIKSTETNPWILVTSAYHMPRSVAAFEKANVNIVPYPVDYRTSLRYDGIFNFRASENIERFDAAIHEYIGLIAYYITGRSSSIFP